MLAPFKHASVTPLALMVSVVSTVRLWSRGQNAAGVLRQACRLVGGGVFVGKGDAVLVAVAVKVAVWVGVSLGVKDAVGVNELLNTVGGTLTGVAESSGGVEVGFFDSFVKLAVLVFVHVSSISRVGVGSSGERVLML